MIIPNIDAHMISGADDLSRYRDLQSFLRLKLQSHLSTDLMSMGLDWGGLPVEIDAAEAYDHCTDRDLRDLQAALSSAAVAIGNLRRSLYDQNLAELDA
jgi:hypothetical protein